MFSAAVFLPFPGIVERKMVLDCPGTRNFAPLAGRKKECERRFSVRVCPCNITLVPWLAMKSKWTSEQGQFEKAVPGPVTNRNSLPDGRLKTSLSSPIKIAAPRLVKEIPAGGVKLTLKTLDPFGVSPR